MKKLSWVLTMMCLLGSASLIWPTGYDVEMVSIPGGTFAMGSNSGDADEKPVHAVTLRAFYMSRTVVTVGQWKKFVADTDYRSEAESGDGAYVWNGQKYEMKKDVNWKNTGSAQSDTHPVTCVSWNDSQAFIKWLNGKTGKSYRLPTEAEWEYGCRAGTTGDRYADIDAIAWYRKNSGQSIHPVGQKQPNGFQLYDMLGNVWEWCQDWMGDYASSSQFNPTGPTSGSNRIARGGGWISIAEYIRAADRVVVLPSIRAIDLGFRLASDATAGTMPADEKGVVEKVIRDSINWALTKDTVLRDDTMAQDQDLFYFGPGSQDTVIGWEQHAKQFATWMDPRFKAVRTEVRDLRVHLSHSGDVSWFSAILDDVVEWDGKRFGAENERWTGVLEKRAGKWLIVQMHFSLASDKVAAEVKAKLEAAKNGKK